MENNTNGYETTHNLFVRGKIPINKFLRLPHMIDPTVKQQQENKLVLINFFFVFLLLLQMNVK